MMTSAKQFVRRRWDAFSQTPFGCLVRLFVGRMFHGSASGDSGELDLGVGVIAILLVMPGMLVSLLMFEKYGSFIRFLRGAGAYDPFSATIPDEYFFLVLSMVVSGAAALWRWDNIFLDRRDFTNLVPLPIGLRSIFLANLCAIFVLVGALTFVVNAASVILFPIAVVGSQPSLSVVFRFAAGHAVVMLMASAFSSFAVFAFAGILMTLLPAGAFRRVSLLARFAFAVSLLALLGTSLVVPQWLTQLSVVNAHRVAVFPPVSFLGLLQTLWGRGSESFVARMTSAALAALVAAFFTTILAYAVSFRRSFMRIPETPDVGPLPRVPFSFSPFAPLCEAVLRTPSQRACYHFVARTLLRSDGHLQVVSGFLALGLVASAAVLGSAPNLHSLISGRQPSAEFLSVAFILAYCTIAGIRLAFEIPADLPANWIFQFWLDRERHEARPIARRVLLFVSLSWLAPACFLATLVLWGWTTALLHTTILILCTVVLVEVLLLKFRKIPFTCPYPSFKSHSGLIGVAYLFGYVFFTYYLPQLEEWSLSGPGRIIWFAPLLLTVLGGIHFYRKQMLDMDKELVFEDVSAPGFD
ncbi:MAG TPA: hypothetical protein VJN92_05095 [Candidatus Acidoferrum sp.]|nr:hypothetical protein [Candidatus Acidoferrum sp.]